MDLYEQRALREVVAWQQQILQLPSTLNQTTQIVQQSYNRVIPAKVHDAITSVFMQMCRAVLVGSKLTTRRRHSGTLRVREAAVGRRITWYSSIAAVEGGLTGFGGIFLGFADFPLLLGIKIKLLFEIASLYGIRTGDIKERFFLLHVLLLAFSSHEKRREIYLKLEDWSNFSIQLPDDMKDLDWRTFQEEYRNYTDLIKLPQLIPVLGAPFGAVVNYQLVHKLGKDAMSAFRMRWFAERTSVV